MSLQTIRKRPTERAFVVQFDAPDGVRTRVRGRVELVASGEATRFRSMKQLVAFMIDVLRKPADDDAPSGGEPAVGEVSR